MRALPARLQDQVPDLVTELATGQIPSNAIPDLDVPDCYQVVASEFTMVCGVYPDEAWTWLLRPNT